MSPPPAAARTPVAPDRPPDRPPGQAEPALVVLVGAAGSGKSTWASENYRGVEIVSSDQLRGIVGSGPSDLDATADAFALLDSIVAARVGRRLTTVIDTLGLDPDRRRSYRRLAQDAGVPGVLVVLDTPAALCRLRNAGRDRPVPAPALSSQLRRVQSVRSEIGAENWDQILVVTAPGAPAAAATPSPVPAASAPIVGRLEFVLQISRFPWGDDPTAWLTAMAHGAASAGFAGISMMDHLIQIPQAGRAWDPMPDPWVALGLIAGLGLGLRVGTLVSPVTFRAPGTLAKSTATLDVLSGGRAFCGLGAGWWECEHLGFGVPFPSAGRRLDQLENTIATVRALWAPGTKAFDSGGAHLPETTCYPRPSSSIPIIVGGGGERRTLLIAARHGDACNLPSEPEVLRHKVEVLRRHCADVGRDPAEVAVTVLDLPVLGVDRDDVAARVERLRGRTSAPVFARRHGAGTREDHLRRFASLQDLGVSTVFLSPPDLAGPADLAAWAPVLAEF